MGLAIIPAFFILSCSRIINAGKMDHSETIFPHKVDMICGYSGPIHLEIKHGGVDQQNQHGNVAKAPVVERPWHSLATLIDILFLYPGCSHLPSGMLLVWQRFKVRQCQYIAPGFSLLCRIAMGWWKVPTTLWPNSFPDRQTIRYMLALKK